MSPIQYDRWKDFAIRMARTCFRGRRKPNAKWIERAVRDFFAGISKDDIPCIVDWDNSVEYPVGNPSYGREYNKTYCSCKGPIQTRHELGKPNPACPECRGTGLHNAVYRPYCVGDMATLWQDEYGEIEWPKKLSSQYDRAVDRCDYDTADRIRDELEDHWCTPVRCCIRAGLDMACAPSMGVLGFTAGDIRRMYPEGVPEWLFPPNERLRYAFSDKVNGTFVELPDEAGLLL